MSKKVVTLKSRSRVDQGHQKWHHSIDCLWFPISVQLFYSKFVPNTHRFWGIRLVTGVTLKPWLGVTLKGIGTDTHRSATLPFHSNHEPISYRYRDTAISVDNSKNPHPLYFASPAKGFPWNWVSALGVKKLESWGYRAEKKVWRYLQPFGYNTPTWRTPGDSNDRAYA